MIISSFSRAHTYTTRTHKTSTRAHRYTDTSHTLTVHYSSSAKRNGPILVSGRGVRPAGRRQDMRQIGYRVDIETTGLSICKSNPQPSRCPSTRRWRWRWRWRSRHKSWSGAIAAVKWGRLELEPRPTGRCEYTPTYPWPLCSHRPRYLLYMYPPHAARPRH